MNNKFNYTYSAPTEEERREIESIRKKYAPQEQTESKLEKLRRLDGKVKTPATIISLCLGIIGCLIFGLGLTLILEWDKLILGIIVMLPGAVLMALAYPAHVLIIKKNKERYGNEIITLSEELLNETEKK